MGEVNHVVDHMTLDYKGVFSAKEFFKMFTKWLKESPYEKGGDYISEQNTSHGKCIEYYYTPWKKDLEYIRHFMKIRILMYDVKKVDIMVQGKKQRLDHGRVIIYLDGFVEHDYESRWMMKPLLQFLRTIFIKFIFKNYTIGYDKIVIDDCHKLYDLFERFYNMYRSYRPVQQMPHFHY